MVVSNSTKIGKRQAKSNAQAQQATRAKKLNAQGQNIPVPTPTLPTPTNKLQPGYNPSTQFDFETGQQKPQEQGSMREAFQAGVDPRVRAIVQQRGLQDPTEARTRMSQLNNDIASGRVKKYNDPSGVRFLGVDENGNETTDVITSQEVQQMQNDITNYDNAVNQANTEFQGQLQQDQRQGITAPGMPDLSGVPAEYKPFIDFYLQNADVSQRQQLAQGVLNTQNSIADQQFVADTATLGQEKKDIESSFTTETDLIAKQEAARQEILAKQKKEMEDELEIQKSRALQKAEQDKKQQLFQMTNALALAGGFADMRGIEYIQKTEQSLNEHYDYLSRSFDIDKRKVQTAFLADYKQIELEADNKIALATKAYKESLTGLQTRTLQASVNRNKSKADALKEYATATDRILKERADNIQKAVDMSIGLIQQQQESKAKEKDRAFAELKWYKDTYGSNLPEGVMEDLQKRLPNMNVQSFFATQTLAERKEAQRRARLGSGGSAWTATFTPTETRSDGTPLSFEEYLEKRKQEEGFYNQQKRDDVAGPVTKVDFLSSLPTKQKEEAFRNRIQAEYIAKLEEKNKYSPDRIVSTLNKAMSKTNVPEHTRENAVANVNALIARGDMQGAYDFVDGLGSAPSATERGAISRAQNARMQVSQLKAKIDELGAMGPVIGRIRELNPYDDKIVEIDAMITTTVPNLARGVFGEVGVLTDFDIKNYTSAMANPKLTHSQAVTLTKNLLNTIDYNVKSQLGVMRASGISTRELESLYEGNIAAMNVPTVEDDYINSYLNSLQYQ